jgi:hypothetical protein
LHVFCSEGRLECDSFVDDTSKGPYVRLVVVWLVPPHLRTRIVRRTGLSVQQPLLGNFTDIHVSKFGTTVLAQKEVGTLEIPVEYLYFMQLLESMHDLYENTPD